jgi:hypothetical protein
MIRNSICARLYNDYLMPSRLDEYSQLLQLGLARSYQVHTVGGLWSLIGAGLLDWSKRHLVLRHDIDTDVGCARKMWMIEKTLGISSTYYFRLCTLDPVFMREISSQGCEVGYHYEEIATAIKNHGLKSRSEVLDALQRIRSDFAANLARIRRVTGLPIYTVASHGDFANRILGTYNWELLRDHEFRKEMRIDLEAYDEAFMRLISSRHCDDGYPTFWTPYAPDAAILRGDSIVYLLIHSRSWRANPAANLAEDWRRLWGTLNCYVRGAR